MGGGGGPGAGGHRIFGTGASLFVGRRTAYSQVLSCLATCEATRTYHVYR